MPNLHDNDATGPIVLRLFTGESSRQQAVGSRQQAVGSRQQGRLTPQSTLGELYELYVLPVARVALRRSAGTVEMDRLALRMWRLYTGDPPLEWIDAWVCAEFVRRLQERRWCGRPLSANTVHTRCVHLAYILSCAGPPRPGRRTHPGCGLIDPPYFPVPGTIQDVPEKDYTVEEIGQMMAAARRQTKRRGNLGRISPGRFWPGLISFAYNTGLRVNSIMTATVDQVGAHHADWLWLGSQNVKGKKVGGDFYLNPAARAAIAAVRSPGPLLFPWRGWPESRTWFYEHLRRIHRDAGLPEGRWFKMHGFRRAMLTWLSGQNLLVAKIAAGHRSGDVLLTNYANRYRIVPQYLDRLPQPAAETEARQRLLF